MYRAILVPLDGSAFGEYALTAAIPIARSAAARIHLVHVSSDVSWIGLTDEQKDPERIYLRTMAERVRGAGIRVEYALLEDELGDVMPAGRPNHIIAEILRDYVSRHDIDVIVLTSHGRSGVSRGWLGSVTDALVRESFVPVIVVRPPRVHAPPSARAELTFRHILLPLDGSHEAEAAIAAASDIAALSGARITLFRAVEPMLPPANPYVHWVLPPRSAALESQRQLARDYLDGVAAALRRRGHGVFTDVAVGTPAAAILRAVRKFESDLVVIATHGRGGVQRLVLGSVADKLVRTSAVPVVIIRAQPVADESEAQEAALGITTDDVLAELGAPQAGAVT